MQPQNNDNHRVWQRMLSGRRLDLRDPNPQDVSLEDIAHGLSRLARWNGQTAGQHTFSVAQHSLLVRDIALYIDKSLDYKMQLYLLLHDAPEYVIGDLISPFKKLIGDEYKVYEKAIGKAIYAYFHLPYPIDAFSESLIKKADRLAAFVEAVGIAGFSIEEAQDVFLDEKIDHIILKQSFATIIPLAAQKSESLFLQECQKLVALYNCYDDNKD